MLGALLAITMLAAGAPSGPIAPPVAAGAIEKQTRLKACVAKVETKSAEALEDAAAWSAQTHNREASVCKALALIALKRVPEGALLLEQLADAGDGGEPGQRANTYSQAGNARLMDLDPNQAIADFTAALKYAPNEPDVLIDRGRAYGLTGDWRNAEEDLSAALDKRPNDALALSLRAEARLQQNVLDLAEKDAEAAVALAPKDVPALLVRGRVREAKRLGKKPD
jgi:tetratricopeptide (TPR) repeat protein